jgi:hypothetical protein
VEQPGKLVKEWFPKITGFFPFCHNGNLRYPITRLQAKIAHQNYGEADIAAEMEADYEGLNETLEEWEETTDEEPLDDDQLEAIKQEIADLTAYRKL